MVRKCLLVLISVLAFQLFEPVFAVISVSNVHPKQGQTVQVVTDEQPNAADVLEFNKQKFHLFPKIEGSGDQHEYVALLAIPADLKPGLYKLHYGNEDKTIEVEDGHFAVQSITLPKSKNNFIESKGEQESMDRAKATLSVDRLWEGAFVPPSSARMSAGFGMRRIVNGKLLSDYFHTGLDYAGTLGSPVKAVSNGKVILAAHGFRLHGNVIAIDHGQGVISIYIHLNSILVKEGQMVKQGEVIGKVGQTGRANGPHLHFSLYVNQVAANPTYWFHQAF